MTSPVSMPAGHEIVASDLDAYENLTAAWTSWVSPTWTAVSVNPTLGNGALDGWYQRYGKTVNVLIRLTWGSTTTGGTGAWQFTLPFTPVVHNNLLGGQALDTSAGFVYPCTARIITSGTPNIDRVGAHTSTGAIGSIAAAHPFTWAVGDVLTIKGTFDAT